MKTLFVSVLVGTIVIRLMDDTPSWTAAMKTAAVAFTLDAMIRRAIA